MQEQQFYSHLIFMFFHCGTAGAQVLHPFNIHFFPLQECGIAGAIVLLALRSLTLKIHIFHFMITTRLRDYGSKHSMSCNRGRVF